MEKSETIERKSVAAVLVKRMVRLILVARYGVRGALKPPLGPDPRRKTSLMRLAVYRWRRLCWQADNALYQWCGIPSEWAAWNIGYNREHGVYE